MSDSPLRDEKYILRAEALIKLALMGLRPWAEGYRKDGKK